MYPGLGRSRILGSAVQRGVQARNAAERLRKAEGGCTPRVGDVASDQGSASVMAYGLRPMSCWNEPSPLKIVAASTTSLYGT